MKYTQLNFTPTLKVATHPDVTAEWCGYDLSRYTFDCFLSGIYNDIYFGVYSNINNELPPDVAPLITENVKAHLGDAFRHIEVGESFIREYTEVEEEGEDLGPKSAPHINVITETDRNIEKWEIGCSHNKDTFATFFDSLEGMMRLITLLEGNLRGGINKGLTIVARATIGADPSSVILNDPQFARIFGKTRINPPAKEQRNKSKSAQKYNDFMKRIAGKYHAKANALWKNNIFYNPYLFTVSGKYEEPKKDFIFQVGAGTAKGKDSTKILMQELYTNAHSDTEDGSSTTQAITDLNRVDCLVALIETLHRHLNRATIQKSSTYWLGNDTSLEIYGTEEAKKRALKILPELDGHVVQGHTNSIVNNKTSASDNDGFEVIANKETTLIYLNPDDYFDAKKGVARTGPNRNDIISLSLITDEGWTVLPSPVVKPGFVNVFDKRADQILSYYSRTDVVTPGEKIHWRFKLFEQFAQVMFQNFFGFRLIPTPHFIACPDFYTKNNLIGVKIESKEQ